MKYHIDNVIGMGESYRSMCRFWSGLVYSHPSLAPYNYYWRLDADAFVLSPINYNVFEFFEQNKLIYGARVVIGESDKAIQGLKEAMNEYFGVNRPSSLVDKYSMYYTNFELGDLRWFRGSKYSNFFKFLDNKAGFHQARWGDAPVHTYAVDIMVDSDDFHFFNDIEYKHGAMHFRIGDEWVMWSTSCSYRHKSTKCEEYTQPTRPRIPPNVHTKAELWW